MLAQTRLTELGFTRLEAEAYCALLEDGPATAYRIAKAIGKPSANTYQALAGLALRGAVQVEEGRRRLYRAAEPDSLLRGLDDIFQARRSAAAGALARLRRGEGDERLYQLADVGQVMQRAHEIVDGAREILLFDMFPGVLEALSAALDSAAARGVIVVGLVYADPPPMRAQWVRSNLPAFLRGRWPGEQLDLVADGARHLTALLSADRASIRRAYTSDSPYLACMRHSGLSAEIRLAAIGRDGADTLASLSLLASYPDGLSTLVGPRLRAEEETCG